MECVYTHTVTDSYVCVCVCVWVGGLRRLSFLVCVRNWPGACVCVSVRAGRGRKVIVL